MHGLAGGIPQCRNFDPRILERGAGPTLLSWERWQRMLRLVVKSGSLARQHDTSSARATVRGSSSANTIERNPTVEGTPRRGRGQAGHHRPVVCF